ncbi:mucin-desulfating sulfatase (N-acetylglucosamine-6-sulfatase) [Photobacterium gaetbulicola]|uniref:Mucin-desulfating sulfatase (N-acetylglucosamine-6-sulfatase) n=1 Tax=Photobacterium gaetbulicola TaxID=1295392 RepID=A0A0B9G1E6_9GAMM|nr:sulfatase [Photobacterium gaetbulicola]KHT62509.1 mucin-desulfating sulfatase (N-acetylglucosamine-6-sulfatase) [Photobacterium gaetbulicola]
MNIKRSTLSKGIGLLLASSAMTSVAAEQERPNILFIFSDDHANQAISAYNPTLGQTPNIDRIANEGAIFERAFVTNSICQPSRASVMSGKHSHKNGVLDNTSRWNPNQVIFPKLLEESGYDTALIGKWHMHPTPVKEFGYSLVLNGAGGQGTYYNPEFIDQDGKTRVIEGYSTDLITDMSLEWLEESWDEDKPFLLKVQYKAPHTPRRPPPRHMATFMDHNFPIPDTLFDDYKTRGEHAENAWMQLYGMTPVGINAFPPAPTTPEKARVREEWIKSMDGDQRWHFDEWMNRLTDEQKAAFHEAYDDVNVDYWEKMKDPMYKRRWGNVPRDLKVPRTEYMYQRFMRDYMGTVMTIDENVGRILDYLDESGLAENTIVVYSSDQSFFIGEHGWAEKRYMYEEGFKMPFMIRWPGQIAPNQRPQAMIQNMDFGPTFLDAAGLPTPEEMQGKSFLKVLKGQTSDAEWQEERPVVYYHYYMEGAHNVPRHDGVRSDRYKLIDFYSQNEGKGLFELYDLVKDPNEVNNVYEDPEYAEVRAMMTTELENARVRYDVPEDYFEAPYPFMNREERKKLGF